MDMNEHGLERNKMKANRSLNGRYCMVADLVESGREFVAALKIGPKRVRLQSGRHFGEVREAGQFTVMEYLHPGEAPPVLAEAMAN
jgi:hypothetical protein